MSQATLSFYWYIEDSFGAGEYLALDLWNGTTWVEEARLSGDVDPEEVWHSVLISLDGYLLPDFKLRFRANAGSYADDANVDVVSITGTPLSPAVGTMHVDDIDMGLTSLDWWAYATATVTVVDSDSQPVEGATIYGHWEDATNDEDAGILDSDGQVTLKSDTERSLAMRAPSRAETVFTFVVDTVEGAGWVYDDNANVETSDSISAIFPPSPPRPTPTPVPGATPTATPRPTAGPGETPSPTPTVATPTPPPQGLSGEGTVPLSGGNVTTEGSKVTLRFDEGAFGGEALVVIEPIPCSQCVAPPQGFRTGDSCFRITAMVDGQPLTELGANVTVCVEYSDGDKAAAEGNPPRLRLACMNEASGQWQVLPTELHTTSGTVCSTTTHLGDWAVLAQVVSGGLAWWHYLLVVGASALVVLLSHTPSRQATAHRRRESDGDNEQ